MTFRDVARAAEWANMAATVMFVVVPARILHACPGVVGRTARAWLDAPWDDPRKTWVGRER